MTKLNQIIAVVAGKKSRMQQLITEAHRGWNKDAIAGIVKRYTPKAEDGEKLPSESKNIHQSVSATMAEIMARLADFYDIVATQECGNTKAAARLIVNGNAVPGLEADLPVTVLLFLEKQVEDLRTLITNLPTLPTDRTWTWDENRGCYVTEPVETVRTQKVPEVIVKYPATDKHPAQTELFAKDVAVGTWETTYLSSAIPQDDKATMLARINALSDGLKSAREAANGIEVQQTKIGEAIMDYVFGGVL